MILFLHIVIATASLLYTGYVFVLPSRSRLRTSYALIAATLVSGTVLLILKPSHLTQTCTTGLTYLAFVSIGTIAARHKLATAHV